MSEEKKGLSLEDIASMTGAILSGDPKHLIYGVDDLESASSKDASFFANPRYEGAFTKSKAGVIFVLDTVQIAREKNYLISQNPSADFQKLVDYFSPKRKTPSGFSGIHPSAIIHPSAKIGLNVTLGPHSVIDEDVEIGSETFIGACSSIGPGVKIGKNCLIYSNVTVREGCIIQSRVIIQPGAVIGSCGFGYTTSIEGKHEKLNQVGNVVIEDDVEIGANTTIDRSRFKSTKIGKGTKIDNLVQIAHGVEIGPHSIIVAQTGIAGSTKLGAYVVLAGQVAVAGHLELASGVVVAGKSGVSKSLAKGRYGGIPAVPIEEYNKSQVILRKIIKGFKS